MTSALRMASTLPPERIRCCHRAMLFLSQLRQQSSFVVLAASLLFAMKVCGQTYPLSIRNPRAPEFQNFRLNDQGANLINIGPFHGQGALGLGYLYNDNAGLGSKNIASENQIFEDFAVDLAWVVTPSNQLTFRTDAQLEESFYSNGQQRLFLQVRPGSALALTGTVGPVIVTAFDNFGIVQDPVPDPTVTGVTNLNRLLNTVGFQAVLPLHDASLGMEFDYIFRDNLSGDTGDATVFYRNSFGLTGYYAIQSSPVLQYGIEATGTDNLGARNTPDIQTFSTGPFLRGRLTRLIDVDLGVGLTLVSMPELGPATYYVELNVRHEVSRIFQYYLGFTHDIDVSTGSSISRSNTTYIEGRLELHPNWAITAGPFFNWGHIVTPGVSDYTQWGITLATTVKLRKNLNLDIGYRYVLRDANTGGGHYKQNAFSCELSYVF